MDNILSTTNPERQKKFFKVIISVISILIAGYIWTNWTQKYVEKKNELCTYGIVTKGKIYKIKEDNLNEGNISSWDLHYEYTNKEFQYFGVLNVNHKDAFRVDDLLSVIYSDRDPKTHQAFEKEAKKECVNFSSALFKYENYIIWIIELAFLIIVNFPPKPEEEE